MASGFRIGALLTIPRAAIGRRVRARCAELGYGDVSAAHEVVLQVLEPDGMRLTELAAKAGMAKQSMGYLVGELERAGYLERIADPGDARAKLIRRTERGWAFNRIAAEVVAELEEEWATLIGEANFQKLKDTLGQLVDRLGHEYRGSVAEASNRRAGRPARASY